MREEIKARFLFTYDADAADPLPVQLEAIAADVARLLDPDSTTGVELIRAEIDGDPLPEAEIYGNNGRARAARTRSGFDAFMVQRVREITRPDGSSDIESTGWTDTGSRATQFGEIHGEPFWTVYARRDGEPLEAIADRGTRARALLLADALADGRAVYCPDSMLPGFRVTWETVTDESAEAGDAAAHGFARPFRNSAGDVLGVDLEPLERTLWGGGADSYAMPLRDALEALEAPGEPWRNLEALEADSSVPEQARSVRAIYGLNGPARDLPGGDSVRSFSLSIHFPETLTPASRARLVALICK